MPVKFCDDDNRLAKDGRPPLPQYPSASKLRPEATDRQDHLQYVIQQRHASDLFVKEMYHLDSTFRSADANANANVNVNIGAGDPFILSDKSKQELKKESAFIKHAQEYIQQVQSLFPAGGNNVEVRVSNFSYQVKLDPNGDKIKTVYNSSFVYEIYSWMKRIIRGLEKAKTGERKILDNICLTLKPGKIYLLLGPPASGKTSLLKAIAGRLSTTNGESVDGSVQYNGLTMEEAKKKGLFITNAIAYIDQLDNHAPRLSVEETFTFAFNCKSAGTHAPGAALESEEIEKLIQKLDKEKAFVKLNMEALGLESVADTFVGNTEVRGISGGQRRRVTLGEQLQARFPVMCGDEISTGLDAASTYDICYTLMHFTRLYRMTRILSLLQPSPATVALFDEVILLAEGRILYAGPISDVEDYFGKLGYTAPDEMDVADFLQVLSTEDGATLYNPRDNASGYREKAYSNKELADIFLHCELHQKIADSQTKSWDNSWLDKTHQPRSIRRRYQISFWRQSWLNLDRNMTIWRRDKRFLFANAIKNLIMGVSVGGVFYQTESITGIYGVLFQVMLFIMLGAMVSTPALVDDRAIYYKHADANFYSAFPYIIGKALALMPQAFTDVMIFGTIIYWMVGLASTASNYFRFIAILFVFSIGMNQMLAVFASFARTKSEVQGYSAVILLFLVLFCGFIVTPDVIPNYYSWIYWWNPFAWSYRALLVNEFQSTEYDYLYLGSGIRAGDIALAASGFTTRDGDAFQEEWVAYNFAYLMSHTFLCLILSGFTLQHIRVSPAGAARSSLASNEEVDSNKDEIAFDIPFVPVNLTFKDICYDVKASTGGDTLRLLTNVSGVFAAGRMCALMGSSGAGKTTLMDTIALRKNTGTIRGDVRVNGFKQCPIPFRRCSGYVEQFDVQSPELTITETVLFSARLRLNSDLIEVNTDEKKRAFVKIVLKALELSDIAESIVGDEGEGTGLSFEQRKRLSIAVELAASPSIIFLDEPTSGLDARAALIVCRALRTIANTGRTVIATIHQPSSAVFELFDDLLLLKKGGYTVFFGELGEHSCKLVSYFEGKGAESIDRGENPANWMLKVITAEDAPCNYAFEFNNSAEFTALSNKIAQLCDGLNPANEIKYSTEFAANRSTIQFLMNQRLQTIYWRSPAYNLTRMIVSCGIAFILGSVFLNNRFPPSFTETEMSSVLSTIFISFIIIGVLAITSVLPVMQKIRDSYYRHRAAGMVSSSSIALGLGTAEKWFICLQGLIFTLFFIATAGLHFFKVGHDIGFWGFFTFNIAIYSYFGQAFMCAVKGSATAQILASVFIGLNNFFSGLIVRPQYLTGLFQFTYWITPGHYVYEGLVMSLFANDQRIVFANPGSEFYDFLHCNPADDSQCFGTIEQFVESFFGGKFKREHVKTNAIVLGGILVVARLSTYFALKYLKFTAS